MQLHLLVQNLLYDIGQTGIPFDNVDADLVRQPLQWQPWDIGRFMLCFGPVSSLFDLACFALMYRLVHSRIGYICMSLQQNEELASSIGVNIAALISWPGSASRDWVWCPWSICWRRSRSA